MASCPRDVGTFCCLSIGFSRLDVGKVRNELKRAGDASPRIASYSLE
jgi:hypothetical protein